MSSLDPADPASAPEPVTPAPSAAPAQPSASETSESGFAPPFAGDAAPRVENVPAAPVRASADGAGGGERRRQNRIALYGTVALIVVLAFAAGIGVGRATVSTGGTAAVSPPAASGALGGSPAPGGSVPASAADSGVPASPAASDALAGLPSDGALLGSKTAKVQLTYWADFQCPFCAKFAQTILPQLASRIADGTVSVLHRDFVFIGPESLDAAIAVRCAGEQNLFWPMHDAVYAAQDGENQGTFTADRLKQLATGVGADGTKFSACTARHDVLVSVLDDTAAGIRAGVKSTPTVDIPGQTFLGVTDANQLIAAIDAAAKTQPKVTPPPSVAPSGDPWAGSSTSGRTAGPDSAKVTVELWVDYQATGMPAIVGNLEPELRKRVDAGKIQVVLRDLATLGDESVVAASFIRCGAQNNEPFVWFAHDILGASAQGANQGIYTVKALLGLASKFGWDVAKLDACMADPATAAAVKTETGQGTAAGLSAAPAVIVKAGGKETARFSGSSLDPAKVVAAIDAATK